MKHSNLNANTGKKMRRFLLDTMDGELFDFMNDQGAHSPAHYVYLRLFASLYDTLTDDGLDTIADEMIKK